MRRTLLLVLSGSALLLSQDPRLFAPSLARLKANDPKAAEDVKPGSPVERTALSGELLKAPWTRKIQASEWLLRAYLFKQRDQAPRPGNGLAGGSDPYLLRAWQLLQGAEMKLAKEMIGGPIELERAGRSARDSRSMPVNSGESHGSAERENFRLALEWIRLEVSWRMKDPTRMAAALAPYRERTSLDTREQLHAFMAAAHTGDWAAFLKWGEELEAAGQIDRLKALATADWALPDYAGLLRQVRLQQPATGPGALPVAELKVKSMGLLLKGFQTGDPALAEKLKAQGTWADSGPIDTPMLRVGAVTHWLKPGATPMPLVGAMTAAELRLEGSADLALQGGTAWRKERYLLKPSAEAPGRWTGSLVVTQQALEGTVPAAQVFTLTFDVRVDLEERPSKPTS